MSDQDRLGRYVETWHEACTDFIALARRIPEAQWELPTDLEGWSVKDNVAHTAHLESVLAGGPEESGQAQAAAHIRNLTGYYTEQGVLARRGRDMDALVDELEEAVEKRYAALQADPPTDGAAAPPITLGGVGWDTATLLSNRPLDVWMHDQDVRRAINEPGGYDGAPAQHVFGVFARSLPMVLGKRVAPPAGSSALIEVPGMDVSTAAVVGDDGRAAAVRPASELTDPTVRIVLSPEDYIVLVGGRRTPDRVSPKIEGDEELGRKVLAAMAVTP